MGGLKEYYLTKQEDRFTKLAEALGITMDELLGLEYEVAANLSKDGLIYEYILQFSEDVDPAILDRMKGMGRNRTVSLAPSIFDSVPEYDHEWEAILENTSPEASFLKEVENLDQLLSINIDKSDVRTILFRQVFISMIGALETYLSDTFINKVAESPYLLERFVENHPEFKKQKFSLSEIFREHGKIEEKAREVMIETIYHKLPAVKKMYEDTFSIRFPDISAMQSFIVKRHDLVHRNGKTKDGKALTLSKDTIYELKWEVMDLVQNIEKSIKDSELPF